MNEFPKITTVDEAISAVLDEGFMSLEGAKLLANEVKRLRSNIQISACYFPGLGEVECTWEDTLTGKEVGIVASVTTEQGEALAEIVYPCVYQSAVVKKGK